MVEIELINESDKIGDKNNDDWIELMGSDLVMKVCSTLASWMWCVSFVVLYYSQALHTMLILFFNMICL